MHGERLEVLDSTAEQQSAGEHSPERRRRGWKSAMAAARFADEVGGHRGHATDLIVGGSRVNEFVSGHWCWSQVRSPAFRRKFVGLRENENNATNFRLKAGLRTTNHYVAHFLDCAVSNPI